MPTQIAQAQGIHPYWTGADTPIGVDETGTKWSISYKGRNAVLLATFQTGVTLEFKIPTDGVNKSGNVAAFTIPNFGDAQWITHREHVKFEVRFPTPPKVTEVSVNIARQNCAIESDGQGGLDVLSGTTKVGALPRPWIEYKPDGATDRQRIWLDWIVAEPTMKLTMPTLTATEWASAVLDPTVITTSTASTATAYSNQRKIDRTSNGVLWAMYWDGTANVTDSMHFRYSADDGATWSDGGGFGFAGTGTTYVPNGSLFIDVDDYAHVAYKDRHSGHVLYRRGTPNAGRTAWTWSAAHALDLNSGSDYPDLVAHREGSGWVAHAVVGRDTSGADLVRYYQVTVGSDGSLATTSTGSISGTYGNTVHKYPSIGFNHTGDGKTVAGGTPHLYVAWSAGATGAGNGIRFKKATYSGGSWTWGTEREIDSTSYANGGRISSVFDGTRVVIAYADSAATSNIKVRERDAADTTTTTRTPTALADGVVNGLSVSHDDLGNIHLGAVGATSSDVKSLKYDRAAGTWGAWESLATTTTQADTLSAMRGSPEFAYTEGAGSPYSVSYAALSLGITAALNPATETATARPLGRVKRKALGTAVDSSTARPFARRKVRALGAVTETALARPITSRPKIVLSLGTAVEAVTARPFGVVQRYPDLFFTPPVRWVGNEFMGEKPFRFYRHAVSMNVVRRNGRFTEVRVVEDQKDHLTEGVDWFSGGRTYQVDNDTRLLLEADGFTVESV